MTFEPAAPLELDSKVEDGLQTEPLVWTMRWKVYAPQVHRGEENDAAPRGLLPAHYHRAERGRPKATVFGLSTDGKVGLQSLEK